MGLAVKGINQLKYLYHAGCVSLPVVVELVRKDAHFYNLQTCQERRDWSEYTAITDWLKGVDFPILFPRQVFKSKDSSCGMLYLVCSQLHAFWNDLTTTYQQRWHVEVFHKILRSSAIFTKPPAHQVRMQVNHLFASIVAVTKLKALNIHTMLNPFALHAKLNRKATRMAFDELQVLRASE